MTELFDRVASFPNLLLAARKAVRGKRGREDVREFLFRLEPALLGLLDQLRAGSWKPGAYRLFTVLEPKPRDIAAVPLPDRVVHHALLNLLEPVVDAESIEQSYACRAGKGMHAAVERARELARRHPYFLKADVRKYYDSVDHAVLKGMLARLVADRRVLDLFFRIVDHQPEGAVPGKGIPIGNLTSQHFANLYLGPLDRALSGPADSESGRYLRYMDDFLLFGRTKEELHRARAEAARVLGDELCLTLKEPGTFVAPVSVGVPFLGLRIFPGTVRLGRGALRRFSRGWRTRLADLRSGRLPEASFHPSAAGAIGHVLQADTWHLRTRLFLRGSVSRPRGAAA